MNESRLKKITVVVHYSVFPPRGGGQNRIFYMYKEIAKFINVEIVTLVHENKKKDKVKIAENLWEIRIPKTKKFARKEWRIFRKVGIPVTDIAVLFYASELKEYIHAFKKSALTSDCIIASHPFAYELVKNNCNKPIIYESHNVEYNLKQQIFTDCKITDRILSAIFDIEKQACRETILTTVCTLEDAERMKNLYGLQKKNILEIPNGFDPVSVQFQNLEERKKNKYQLGLESTVIALFIGSWHQPNIDAVYKILEMANQKKKIIFIIIGSVGHYFAAKKYPSNVGFMGVVDDEVKKITYGVVDVALNPMMSGSGSNLKILDYIAAGIPVITTHTGIRGLLDIPDNSLKICDISMFNECIETYCRNSDTVKSYEYVNKKYTWAKIAQKFLKSLQKI